MSERIYIDSNTLIYLIEGHDDRKSQVQNLLAKHSKVREALNSSEIIAGKCLRGAISRGEELAKAYRKLLFEGDFMRLHPVTLELITRAAVLGAELNMKLVDAIHVATAEALECSVFLTNDRGIRAPAGLELRYLSAEA